MNTSDPNSQLNQTNKSKNTQTNKTCRKPSNNSGMNKSNNNNSHFNNSNNYQNSILSSHSNNESQYQLKFSYSKPNEHFQVTNYLESTFNSRLLSDNEIEIEHNKELIVNKQYLEKRNYCCSFVNQVNTLLWKNFLLFSRNLKNTVFQILTPIFALLIVLLLQGLLVYFNKMFINRKADSVELQKLVNCKEYRSSDIKRCRTIRYNIYSRNNKKDKDKNNNDGNKDYIPNEIKAYYEDIMKSVALSNDLNFDQDIEFIDTYYGFDLSDYFNQTDNKNLTSYGVSFCYESMDYAGFPLPCESEYLDINIKQYIISYNHSLVNDFMANYKTPYSKHDDILKLKIDLDNAILKQESLRKRENNNNKYNDIDKSEDYPKISDITLSDYPSIPSRLLENADAVATYGGFYFYFVAMVNFVITLLEVMREKEKKLRKSLIIIGLKTNAYWFSWILTSIVFSIISSVVLCLFGLILRLSFFTNSNFFVLVIIMFVFIMSMQFFAFFLVSIISKTNTAYTVAYALIILGLIIQSMLTNAAVIELLYSDDLPEFVGYIKLALYAYPPFSFSILIAQVVLKACYIFNSQEGMWIKGSGFWWKDLFEGDSGNVMGSQFSLPKPISIIGVLILNSFIFMMLCWYIDHVNEENQGKKYGYFFFFSKSYWFGSQSNINNAINIDNTDNDPKDRFSSITNNQVEDKTINNNDSSNLGNSNNSNKESKIDNKEINPINDDSVKLEKSKTLISNNSNSLRILGLTKTYTLNKNFCNKKTIKALSPTYLEIPENELFTIIGHNGAGKTTLINLLTGNIKQTEGKALVYGKELNSDNVETLIGLCPQHDILWEELTPKEHIYLYSHFRNIKNPLIPKFVQMYLRSVNLEAQQDNQVSTFSGGMKRRLSILLSTIGEPKVVFLDEPTTGLDPVNKRFIWKMISEIKKDRSVILTTHAMEEAEFLSNRIGVIKEGVFKTIGTSLELKEKYGSGYLLTFVVGSNDIDIALKELEINFPSGKILGTQGGCIIMNLSVDKIKEIKVFVKLLNRKGYDNSHDVNIDKMKNNVNNSNNNNSSSNDSNSNNITNKFSKGKEEEDFNRLSDLVKDCGMDFTTLEEIFLKVSL